MKFKVFDKEKKEFVENKSYYLSKNGNLTLPGYDCSDGSIVMVIEFDLIPIFSTGQKDIDGNDIYEGDVVEAGFPLMMTIIATLDCEIEKNSRSFRVFENKKQYMILEKYGSYPDGRVQTEENLIKYKIIGSIYTNPKLLEATK